jgi:ribosomal protein S27AE
MGRMKELYIQMFEEKYEGDPLDYIKQHLDKINKNFSYSNILCPNCMKEKLVEHNSIDLACFKCGYDFIKINENSVKFK